MPLFAERGPLPDDAEAVAAVEPAKSKRAYHQPSRDLRLWVVDYALLRHLQGWDNRMIADHLAAWLPDVFRPGLSMRTLRRWLDENKKEGREPRDAVDAIISILREKCDRVGEAGVPVSASVMQPIFDRVADQHGMARRFGKRWIRHFLRCAGFKYRVASGGTKKTTDPKLVDTHVDKLRLRLMYYVTEYGVHLSCIMNMDETAAKLLGLGQRGWARPKQDGRVRFIGAANKRNITISTVVTMTGTIMAQLIVEGATKRVVQDLPQHEKLSYSFSERHREHMPGADRVAWRLGPKTRVLALGAAVGLCLCPSKGLLAGMDPYCSSGVPRALHSGWLHSGAAASRHRDPAASQAQHQTAGHAILCRIRVPERGGA